MADFQNEPMQDGNDSTVDEKIQGIADQVKADIDLDSADVDVSAELQQRAREAGVPLTAADADAIADDIANSQ
ncbi:hypothetical protein [Marisediminicola antarctica]|uniref:Uncharacterized protein n=1 Tax=Marisediminicola antarctica TaxID=674079 RepID=A0A7L5AHI1_9MICO|nr:hypothetical protein [Marisediminicola antarctica]QHO68844.1 hypothetical protein BHD05_03505 [Marisediminicola antarctica]